MIRLWNYHLGTQTGEPLGGHRGAVLSVGFSRDGDSFVSGSYDGRVMSWDARVGVQLHAYSGHQEAVASVAVAPDGRAVASGSYDSTVRIWGIGDVDDETAPLVLRGHSEAVNAVAFSQDGLQIASGSGDCTIWVWNAARGSSVSQPLNGHSDVVNSVAISHDGRFLASGSADGSARVWNAYSCEQIFSPLLGHDNAVSSLVFSSDDRWIATGSVDTTLRLWNTQTGRLAMEALRGHTKDVNTLAFSPDDLHLVSGSDDETVRVWVVSNGRPAPIPLIKCGERVCSVAYSPSGGLIAAGDGLGGVWILDSVTGNQVFFFKGQNSYAIISLAFTPKGDRIVAVSNQDVCDFDFKTGDRLLGLNDHRFLSSDHFATTIAQSPERQLIASGGMDHTVRLWDIQTIQALEPILCGHGAYVSSVVFSPDGRFVISGGGDSTIRIWDLESARSLAAQCDRDTYATLSFARCNKDGWLVSPTDELLLWVPPEYRGRLEIGNYSRIIATHRAVVTVASENDVWHHGKQWIRCWGTQMHQPHN